MALPANSFSGPRAPLAGTDSVLLVLFTLSGVSALVYQICWQRILFFSLGSDIESITIIISAFMLGLGAGALVGGWLADKYPRGIVGMFAAFELGIGLFGLVSVFIIQSVSEALVLHDHMLTALATFLILLVPTLLMGATLPMLICHFFRHQGNVGVSTGQLYCVNTLGAAAGSTLAGFVAFHYLTLPDTINAAAGVNVLVAVCGYVLFRRQR